MKTYEVKDLLECNSYPGRGIIIGKSPGGEHAVIAYFIMGRSENSRNRVFAPTEDGIIIYPFDESRVSDPSLIIYNPVRVIDNFIIVTNGDQTDTIYDFIKAGRTFEDALATRCFEPDAPNYTPRISGIVIKNGGDFSCKLSILKSTDDKGSACSRFYYEYASMNGAGHFIHTYEHDGDPIPSFEGEPRRIGIPNRVDEFTDLLWTSLDGDNKVSLYVNYISLEDGKYSFRMRNKNQKGADTQ